MASNYSPSVIPTETDFSDYAVRSSTTILAVIGQALKGPVDTPYLINSESELIEVFGNPAVLTKDVAIVGDTNFSGNIITDCIQYLREGNQLYVIRTVSGTAVSSEFIIEDAGNTTYLTLTATSPGKWANGYDFSYTGATNGLTTYLDLTITDVAGDIVELYQNLAGPDIEDDPTNLPEARINGTSSLFTVKQGNGGIPVTGTVTEATTPGADGSPPEQGDLTAALELLRDTELYTVNLIAIPQAGAPPEVGLADRAKWHAVYGAAISVCESRGECMVLIDPYWSDVIGVSATTAKTNLINGASGFYDFDSSQAALYGPWLQVYDGYSRKTVWVAPSCVIVGQYSYNDRVSQAWFAPAGVNRGKLRLVQDVSVVFTRDHLEGLQAPRMITNPIRPIINEGITIWGQRTAQRKATALNRVNARRMLNSAKHTIATATRVLLFEQNDSDTWLRFINIVTPAMQYIKDTRGVYEFRVICDESTNPPAQIDQNIMRGKILLKPTKTAETIFVDFSVLNTGANFDEFV